MAECLIRAGFALTVCDKSEVALDVFRKLGARTTTEASDLAGMEMVVFMVANDAQVKSAALGAGGLLQAVDPAKPPLVAVMSSVLPGTAKEVAAALAAKNVRMVDAPVSGGGVRAGEGKLTIMVGGDKADIEAMSPVFDALGNNVFHCGPVGAGEAVKILNNIMGVTSMFLMTETMQIAGKLGIDQAWLASVMEVSSGRNSATRDYEAHKGIYRVNGQTPQSAKAVIDICRKDLSLAMAMAREVGVATPMVDAAATAQNAIDYDDFRARWVELAA